jgi:methionyl-tRNA formyltransferase
MNYAFFGTPRFAALVLEELISHGLVPRALIANPDRPVSRKQVMTPPLTKKLLLSRLPEVPIFQPEQPLLIVEALRALQCDLFIVAAYAQILPKEIISLPKWGTLGVHPSLLPRHRGSSPIQTAILEGDTETGVSIYELDEKMDHGPIAAQRTLPIDASSTYLSLETALAKIGGELVADLMVQFKSSLPVLTPQEHGAATFTKKFATNDGLVRPGVDTPALIARKIRALNPEPGVFTINGTERIKYLEASFVDEHYMVTKIQRAGKKPETARIKL